MSARACITLIVLCQAPFLWNIVNIITWNLKVTARYSLQQRIQINSLDQSLSLRKPAGGIVEGCQSGWVPEPSGVPQGLVLAPYCLHCVMEKYRNAVLRCSVKIFTDDSKLYRSVHASPSPLALHFHEDLDAATCWADIWKLEFNTENARSYTLVVRTPSKSTT